MITAGNEMRISEEVAAEWQRRLTVITATLAGFREAERGPDPPPVPRFMSASDTGGLSSDRGGSFCSLLSA